MYVYYVLYLETNPLHLICVITFMYHLLALVIVSVFCFAGSWFLYFVVNKIIPLRVTEDQEIRGLDASQHGENF